MPEDNGLGWQMVNVLTPFVILGAAVGPIAVMGLIARHAGRQRGRRR